MKLWYEHDLPTQQCMMRTMNLQMPLFIKDTNDTPCSSKYVMPRRNYCSVELNSYTGALIFDIRVEKEKGGGQTVG
jgi:hypothetical protein